MRFKNRIEAGQKLAQALAEYQGQGAAVYALPRGGVVLGHEIAKKLGAPLDLVITRKIGHPLEREYAVCAIAEDGHTLCDEAELALLDKKWLKNEFEKEQKEAKRRRKVYLEDRKPLSAENKIAIIVDDGIATGLTMLLAISEIKHQRPRKIVVAVPVVPKDIAPKIKKEADELVVLEIPEIYLYAVGAYYENFPQVEDEEVIELLKIKQN